MKDFWIILKRLRGYRLDLALVIFFNILYSVFTVVSIPVLLPFFNLLFNQELKVEKSSNQVLNIINETLLHIINTSGRESALLQVCLLIVFIFLLKNIARYFASFFMIPVRVGFVTDLRNELYNKYISIPYQNFPSMKTGDLISRITADVNEIEASIVNVIEVVLKAPIVILGSILLLVYLSPQLTIFVLVLLFFTALIMGRISKTLKKKSARAQSILGEVTNQVEESITSIKVIKAYGAEHTKRNFFSRLNDDYKKTMNSLWRRNKLSGPVSEFLGVTVVMILMYYGAHLVFREELVPGTFFAFILAFFQIIEPSKSLSTAYYSIQKGLAAYDRVYDHLNLESEPIERGSTTLGIKNTLELKGVTHRYNETRPVLSTIDLQINKGDMIAVVGPSGGGKTTLIDIIVGLLPVQEGDIVLDGVSKSEYNISEWRSLFSLVTQSPILFHDTIYNNITMGRQVEMEKVQEACRVANALEFIEKLPETFHTDVGEKGMKLSGGQRQRITIARAILNDSDILILDEATSALDSESEKLVQEALETITKEKTSIVIAHRLSTVKDADRIIVLKDGVILDIGGHDQLMERSTMYRSMVERQSFDS